MDAFAAVLGIASRISPQQVVATYQATDEAGVARVKSPDSALALVSLPFFLEHEKGLGLRVGELQPVPVGSTGEETWTLLAAKGKVTGPSSLKDFTILSIAGFSPRFIAGFALGRFGKLPPSTRIEPTTAVLSALRRASAGENIAVLLNGEQAAALPSLAFASNLETVATSGRVPVGILARVRDRVSTALFAKLESGLKALPETQDGKSALAGIRMQRFDALDTKAVTEAKKAFAEAGR